MDTTGDMDNGQQPREPSLRELILGLDGTLAAMRENTDRQFAAIMKMLEQVNGRISDHENRIGQMEGWRDSERVSQ